MIKKFKNIRLTSLFTCVLFLLIIVAALTAAGCGKDTPEKPAETTTTAIKSEAGSLAAVIGNTAQISDIHFNPFYDSTLFEKLKNSPAEQWETIFAGSKIKDVGTYGDFSYETDYPLLLSAFKHMTAVTKNLDFIIFTGDFLAHTFHDRYEKVNNDSTDGLYPFIDKTLTFFVIMLEKYFPGIPVYFCLGNNDSYNGDYDIEPEGDFLKKSAVLFSGRLLKDAANRTAFMETYPIGGYYTIVPAQNPGTCIISLNANFFSRKYKTDFAKYNPADKELDWLAAQLQSVKAKKEKAWLLLHIPPGTDVYGTVKTGAYVEEWNTEYNTRFIQLLTDYADVIIAGFAGHTHMDDFRLLQSSGEIGQQALVFLHICPGIDSLFGNNPGFETMTYNRRAFSLVDYNVYYLDLQKIAAGSKTALDWEKEYNFSAVYKQPAITAAALQKVHAAIYEDAGIRVHYMNYYDVNHKKAINDENWKAYWCGITQWTQSGFEACGK